MNDVFCYILTAAANRLGVALDDEKKEQLWRYYQLLIETNKEMNLTALTSVEDVAIKHFADSLTVLRHVEIEQGAGLIDVGTGAGFPGLVLKIARPDLKVCLLDSLEKRLDFLKEVCTALGLCDVDFVHGRAEILSKENTFRDSIDFAVARAVAPLNTLCEYCLPYVCVGGRFIAMKGRDGQQELKEAENAIETLGAAVEKVAAFSLENAGERTIITMKKTAPTPTGFPRSIKKIRTKPL